VSLKHDSGKKCLKTTEQRKSSESMSHLLWFVFSFTLFSDV